MAANPDDFTMAELEAMAQAPPSDAGDAAPDAEGADDFSMAELELMAGVTPTSLPDVGLGEALDNWGRAIPRGFNQGMANLATTASTHPFVRKMLERMPSPYAEGVEGVMGKINAASFGLSTLGLGAYGYAAVAGGPEAVARHTKAAQKYPVSDAAQAFQAMGAGGGTAGEQLKRMWEAAKADPASAGAIVPEITLESMTMSGPSMMPGYVGGALATKFLGPKVGYGVQAGLVGSASFAQEFGGAMVEKMAESGYDPTKADDVREALSDPAFRERALKSSAAKAGTIAIVDALSAGVGRMLGSKRMSELVAKQALRKIALNSFSVAVNATLDAAGEYLGQMAAGEDTDMSAVLAEVLAGIPQTGADMAMGAFDVMVGGDGASVQRQIQAVSQERAKLERQAEALRGKVQRTAEEDRRLQELEAASAGLGAKVEALQMASAKDARRVFVQNPEGPAVDREGRPVDPYAPTEAEEEAFLAGEPGPEPQPVEREGAETPAAEAGLETETDAEGRERLTMEGLRRRIRDSFERRGQKAPPVGELETIERTDDDAAAANILGQVLSPERPLRVRYIRPVEQGGRGLPFNGTLVRETGEVFIRSDSENPAVAVLVHEVGHMMERESPQAYRAFLGVVRESLREGALREYASRLDPDMMAGLDDEALMREVANDALVLGADRAGFWQELADTAPESLRAVVEALGRVAERIGEALGRVTDAHQVASLMRSRKAVARVREAAEAALRERVGVEEGAARESGVPGPTVAEMSAEERLAVLERRIGEVAGEPASAERDARIGQMEEEAEGLRRQAEQERLDRVEAEEGDQVAPEAGPEGAGAVSEVDLPQPTTKPEHRASRKAFRTTFPNRRGPAPFVQRSAGTYYALDEPFRGEEADGTEIVTNPTIEYTPARILDPNGLLEGTNPGQSWRDHNEMVRRVNQRLQQEPIGSLNDVAKMKTEVLREMGYEGEVGWVDGPESGNRELVLFAEPQVAPEAGPEGAGAVSEAEATQGPREGEIGAEGAQMGAVEDWGATRMRLESRLEEERARADREHTEDEGYPSAEDDPLVQTIEHAIEAGDLVARMEARGEEDAVVQTLRRGRDVWLEQIEGRPERPAEQDTGQAGEPWEMTREAFVASAPSMREYSENLRSRSDVNLRVANKLDGQVAVAEGPATHASLMAEKGWIEQADRVITGFVDEDGRFLYQDAERAHGQEIESALRRGERVPLEALREHPDLIEKYGVAAIYDLPVERVETASISLDPDRFQFKGDVDKKGVKEGDRLEGRFTPVVSGPILVWEDRAGHMWVVNGHHRFDLAERSGTEWLDVMVLREEDGVTPKAARILGAEFNILDGTGDYLDYATYFKNTGIKEDMARQRGLLARHKGRAGFALGSKTSRLLYEAWINGALGPLQTAAIAEAAPNNESLQAAALEYATGPKKPSIEHLKHFVKALATGGGRHAPVTRGADQTQDMFGLDDAGIQLAVEMSREATRIQRELGERISAVQGAARRPEKAKALGVDVGDPAAVLAEVERLKHERSRWDRWETQPELAAELRRRVGAEEVEFQFAGARAETAGNVERAEAMEKRGAERERIWRATGWWRGADGRWRFEVDSEGLEIVDQGWGDLGDLVRHPRAFKAYPHLQRIWTNIEITPERPDASGLYRPAVPASGVFVALQEEIRIVAPRRHVAREFLVHEIQHAIQHYEGFVTGSNMADQSVEFDLQMARIHAAYPELDETQARFEAYRAQPGEVEARVTQARLDMSPAERRAEPPWETERRMLAAERGKLEDWMRREGGVDFQARGRDADYLAAVESGDTETARQMVDAAAKRAGYNVGPVWHGSEADFTAFDPNRMDTRDEGFWFTTSQKEADGYAYPAKARRYFLRLRNPVRQVNRDVKGNVAAMSDSGADGILRDFGAGQDAWRYGATKEYAVFSPSQIKSAEPVTRDDAGNVIPLSERFDERSDDIRFQARAMRDAGQKQTETVQGAARRPEKAKALGVDVGDPAAVLAEVERLKHERSRWDRWETQPELAAELRRRVGAEEVEFQASRPYDRAARAREAFVEDAVEAFGTPRETALEALANMHRAGLAALIPLKSRYAIKYDELWSREGIEAAAQGVGSVNREAVRIKQERLLSERTQADPERQEAKGQVDLFEGVDFQARGVGTNLVAVHNLSLDSLRRVLKAGGLRAPSFTVGAMGMSPTGYGEISLIPRGNVMTREHVRYSNAADAHAPMFRQAAIDEDPRDERVPQGISAAELQGRLEDRPLSERIAQFGLENIHGVRAVYYTHWNGGVETARGLVADAPSQARIRDLDRLGDRLGAALRPYVATVYAGHPDSEIAARAVAAYAHIETGGGRPGVNNPVGRDALEGALQQEMGLTRPLSPWLMDAIEDVAHVLRTEWPTPTVEAKSLEDMPISDIAVALVPQSREYDAAAAELQAAGVDVRRYDRDTPSGHAVALRQFAAKDQAQREGGADFQARARDADYLAAVERGDLDEAQRMVDEAAKRAGYREEAYHGTATLEGDEPFYVFDTTQPRTFLDDEGKIFFTSSEAEARDYAGGVGIDTQRRGAPRFAPRIVRAFLKTENPYRTTVEGETVPSDYYDGEGLSAYIDTGGFDSVIVENLDTGDQLFVLSDPSQIKSAEPVTRDDAGKVIPLSERFDERSDDIRFQAAGLPADYLDREEVFLGDPGESGEQLDLFTWPAEIREHVERQRAEAREAPRQTPTGLGLGRRINEIQRRRIPELFKRLGIEGEAQASLVRELSDGRTTDWQQMSREEMLGLFNVLKDKGRAVQQAAIFPETTRFVVEMRGLDQIEDPVLRKEVKDLNDVQARLRHRWLKRDKPLKLNSVWDIDIALAELQEKTGIPVFDFQSTEVDPAVRDVEYEVERDIEKLFEGLELSLKDVVGNKDLQERVVARVEGDLSVDLSADEEALAQRVVELFAYWEPFVKYHRHRHWMRTGQAPANVELGALVDGRDILRKEGKEAYRAWLDKQDFGIRQNYFPHETRPGEGPNIGPRETPVRQFGSGHMKTREPGRSVPKPLIRGIEGYLMQARRLRDLQPRLDMLAAMLKESGIVEEEGNRLTLINRYFDALMGKTEENDWLTGVLYFGQRWFWRTKMVARLADWFIRNKFQPMVFGLPKTFSPFDPIWWKHAWRLAPWSPTGEVGVTRRWREMAKDPQAAEFFHRYISNKSGLKKHILLLEQVDGPEGDPSGFLGRLIRLCDKAADGYALSDTKNRAQVFVYVLHTAREALARYRKNPTRKNYEKLLTVTAFWSAPPAERARVAQAIDQGADDTAIYTMAKRLTDNTQWRYGRTERGLAWSVPGKGGHLVAPIATFSKGVAQTMWFNGVKPLADVAGAVKRGERKELTRGQWLQAQRALVHLSAWIAVSAAANALLGWLRDKDRKDYGLSSLFYSPGGPSLGALQSVMRSAQLVFERRDHTDYMVATTLDELGRNFVPGYQPLNLVAQQVPGLGADRTEDGQRVVQERYSVPMDVRRWVKRLMAGDDPGEMPADYRRWVVDDPVDVAQRFLFNGAWSTEKAELVDLYGAYLETPVGTQAEVEAADALEAALRRYAVSTARRDLPREAEWTEDLVPDVEDYLE